MTHSDQSPRETLANVASLAVGIPDADDSTSGIKPPTLKSIGTIDIEAQVLRNGYPFTRPTRWSAGTASFEPGQLATWKLFGGSANLGENVGLSVVNLGYIAPDWFQVEAVLMIDLVPFPSRPGALFVDSHRWTYGGWSCIIHFPIMSHMVSLGGHHDLLLRTVVT